MTRPAPSRPVTITKADVSEIARRVLRDARVQWAVAKFQNRNAANVKKRAAKPSAAVVAVYERVLVDKIDGIRKVFDERFGREIERRVIAKAQYDRKVDTAVAALAELGDGVADLQKQREELRDLADEVHKLAEHLNPDNAPRGPRRFQ